MAVSRALPQNVSASNRKPGSTLLPVVSDFTLAEPLAITTIPQQTPPSDAGTGGPLRSYFDALFVAHGPQRWWPGRTRFEIIAGAILTQNTSWTNVERTIRNLRSARLLSPGAIRRVRFTRLATLLRPSGYFRQKTKTLKSFVTFLYKMHGGSLPRLFATPAKILRDQLLAVRGIGPETADSILLYAGRLPVFVVDAYSRRILERHGHAHPKTAYDEVRKMFEAALPVDQQLFNEYHALIVHVGKNYCRPNNPRCSECSLSRFLPQSTEPGT